MQVLTTAGSFSTVLDRALPAPAGSATVHEASRPEVISAAAAAARALDRTELADSLIDSLPDGIDKQFAILLHGIATPDPESIRAQWTALLDDLDETRAEQLMQAVMHLAELGVDRSARLNTLVETGMLRPEDQALARATAAAARDLQSGLPALRILADADAVAATKMIELLAISDRLDDAQAAAMSAHSRFGEPRFLVQRAGFLMLLRRSDEARAAASDALGHASLDAFGRRTSHRILAAVAVREAESATDTSAATQSWNRAERHPCLPTSGETLAPLTPARCTRPNRDTWCHHGL